MSCAMLKGLPQQIHQTVVHLSFAVLSIHLLLLSSVPLQQATTVSYNALKLTMHYLFVRVVLMVSSSFLSNTFLLWQHQCKYRRVLIVSDLNKELFYVFHSLGVLLFTYIKNSYFSGDVYHIKTSDKEVIYALICINPLLNIQHINTFSAEVQRLQPQWFFSLHGQHTSPNPQPAAERIYPFCNSIDIQPLCQQMLHVIKVKFKSKQSFKTLFFSMMLGDPLICHSAI